MSLPVRSLLLCIVCFLSWRTGASETPQAIQQDTSHAESLIKVASINLCADQLVLLLADKEQILSLSTLSHEEAGSYFFEKARSYPTNDGHAEEILNLQPDVVIVGQYSNKHTVSLLRELELELQTLPLANSVEAVLNNIASVAKWLGHEERGEAVITALQARLLLLEPANEPRPIAAAYDPNGYTSGRLSVRGQILELAGWQNAASLAGIESYGKLTLEAMIKLRPDALIDSPYSPGTYSRAQAMNQHPALLAAGINPHVISIPSRMTVCGGPWTFDVIDRLLAERSQWLAGEK